MAVSPILLNSLPFDATKDHTLQFTYSGSQVFAHRVVVKNNTTNEVVYDKKTSAMSLLATIPANTLTNGNTYNFQVSVFDHEDVESPMSNVVILKCFLTPTFELVGITESMIVRNSFLDATINYVCEDTTEPLNAYTVMVYDATTTTVIYDSGTRHLGDGLTVQITGLMDDTTYNIRATGQTISGMELDTGIIQIMCDYLKPDLFLVFRADNLCDEGTVRLSSNFVLIEGESNPEELIYIDDEKVSLLNGEKVWFDKGYVADNYTLEIVAESIPDFATILNLNMQNAKAYLTWNYGTFVGYDSSTYYAELTAYEDIGGQRLNYIQISNRIDPLVEGEQVHIWLRHVNGAFDLKIAKYIKEETIETVEEITEEGDAAWCF